MRDTAPYRSIAIAWPCRLLLALLLLALSPMASAAKLGADGLTGLTVAVRQCDLAAVRRILAAGADPDDRNSDGTTALMWIGYFINPPESLKLEIAKALVSRGADVNAKDMYGKSALSYQAQYGLGDVAAFLVKAGATDPPAGAAPSGGGQRGSALLTAIESGDEKVVQRLLGAGLDPNRDREIWAAMHYPSDAVRAAMLASRKVDRRSPFWMQHAASEGRLDVVRRLLAGRFEVDGAAAGNRTPLLLAIENGESKVALALIEGGASIEIVSAGGYGSINGETALCLASRLGDRKVARSLLAAGADVDATCGAVVAAALKGDAELVGALVRAGADLRDRRTGHWKALFIAAERDRADIADVLLKGGVRVDVRDVLDSTPLMIAASKGSLALIRLLVRNGASLEATNAKRPVSDVGSNFIGTPLGWAIEHKQMAAADLLRQLGARR